MCCTYIQSLSDLLCSAGSTSFRVIELKRSESKYFHKPRYWFLGNIKTFDSIRFVSFQDIRVPVESLIRCLRDETRRVLQLEHEASTYLISTSLLFSSVATGISVAGGMHSQRGDIPVYVTNVQPGSCAARSRRIRVRSDAFRFRFSTLSNSNVFCVSSLNARSTRT